MARSLKVAYQYIKQVKEAVRRRGYARQIDLAEELQFSPSTIWNFLNGRPVDSLIFYEICEKLGQNLEEIADFKESDNTALVPAIETTVEDLSIYIKRSPIELLCDETIQQPGSLIRIKAPKRMGKSLLIAKILQQAKQYNYRTISLSLLLAEKPVLQELDEFLRWFCLVVSEQLELPDKLASYWNTKIGSKLSCRRYFGKYILPHSNLPLILALDDVEQIFDYPDIADGFLSLLRVLFDEARSNEIFRKLRLVLAYSTEEYINLDVNKSPFNVGTVIEIPDFTIEQIQSLAARQGIAWNNFEVKQVSHLLGGHPYLIQKAIYALKKQEICLEKLLKTAATDTGIYSDYLRGHLWNLQRYPELAEAMKKAVEATKPIKLEPMLAFKLKSLGLIQSNENGWKVSYALYAQYFRNYF